MVNINLLSNNSDGARAMRLASAAGDAIRIDKLSRVKTDLCFIIMVCK